jgi:hypothetical protein
MQQNTEVNENDSMPAEVALAFLTNPKAKITNTFRKICRAARDTVTPSYQTLECEWEDSKKTGFLTPTSKPPITDETKIERRFRHVEGVRLHRVIVRCERRQRQVLNAVKQAKTDFVRQQLATVWQRLELARTAAITEIHMRLSVPPQPGRRHPLWKKRAATL